MNAGLITITFGGVVTLMLSAMIAGSSGEKTAVVLISGGTVIDCTGGPPIRDAAVLIEGDMIKAVGPRNQVRAPRGVKVVDASGKFVMPGLIDMHVHYREWHGELFLAGGVTTVKDLGNPVEWISHLSGLQKDGEMRGPRIFYVGNNIDSPLTDIDHAVRVDNLRDAELAVVVLERMHVTAIKVRQKISAELLRVITKTAHADGLPVTGHLGNMSAREAALAGIDGLEHATGVAIAASDRANRIKTDVKGISAYLEDMRSFAEMNSENEAALIKLLVEKNVKLIPTISVRRRAVMESDERALFDNSRMADDPGLAYVPEQVRMDWRASGLEQRIRESFSKEDIAVMREGYRRLELFIKNFHAAGGVVIAGTDTLGDAGGLTMHRELWCLQHAGLSPMEALITGTRDAARFLGHSELGTIEPGKTADLLIVGADPLDDVRNLAKIERVFQAGREIDRTFHSDYRLPPARPKLSRPLVIENALQDFKSTLRPPGH
jgi:imidazolonepropionase-like amidohydrolase